MQTGRLVLGERVMQLSAPTGWALAMLGAVIASVVACSSSPALDDFGGGFVSNAPPPDFSGPSGAGSSGPLPPSGAFSSSTCPPNMPVEGESCFRNYTCEYGTAVDPACNVIARCDATDQVWRLTQPTRCPTACPGHFDERAPGTTCSGTDVCTYLEATCGCAGAIDGAWTSITGGSNDIADAGDEASSDGGAPAAVGRWQCIRPGNGCPARRPLEGTRCEKAVDCDYGTCVFGVSLAMSCVGGLWTSLFVGSCP